MPRVWRWQSRLDLGWEHTDDLQSRSPTCINAFSVVCMIQTSIYLYIRYRRDFLQIVVAGLPGLSWIIHSIFLRCNKPPIEAKNALVVKIQVVFEAH